MRRLENLSQSELIDIIDYLLEALEEEHFGLSDSIWKEIRLEYNIEK